MPLPQLDVVNSDGLQSNHALTEYIVVSAVLLRRVRCVGAPLGADGRASLAPSFETVGCGCCMQSSVPDTDVELNRRSARVRRAPLSLLSGRLI
jgi:hypothetical protein